MFSSITWCFLLFLFLSLSANAETLRGALRELDANIPVIEDEKVDPVPLGTARNYAILAKTGISTVPTSVITGHIAVSPASSTAMTGFSFTLGSDGQFSRTTQVVGDSNQVVGDPNQAYAPDVGGGMYESALTQAVLDMEDAYNDAVSRVQDDAARINLATGLLDGVTLTPGVYTFTTGVTLTGDISFDGNNEDVFIIQMAGNLVQASGKRVILKNGVLAKNIFWQVAGTVSVMAGAHMEGVLLGKTSVTFVSGSTLNGRVMSQTACILQVATITAPIEDFIDPSNNSGSVYGQ
jgi:hypothetical protein